MKFCGLWGSLPLRGKVSLSKNAVGAGLCSARGRLPCEKLSRKSVATSGLRAEQSPAPTNPQQRRYSYPGVRYFFDSLSFPLRGKPSLPPNLHKTAPFLRNRKSCAFALFIFIVNKSKTIPRQNSSPVGMTFQFAKQQNMCDFAIFVFLSFHPVCRRMRRRSSRFIVAFYAKYNSSITVPPPCKICHILQPILYAF